MLPSLYSNLPLPSIGEWLDQTFMNQFPLSIYSSVDVRISKFKAASVDTNLFPAGFNNLHPNDLPLAATLFKSTIDGIRPDAKRILLVPEEHTRNLWYLENISVLQNILESAGYDVLIATFLDNDPKYCGKTDRITVASATGTDVTLNCLHRVIQSIRDGRDHYDLAILNNDLTAGIPTVFSLLDIPIAPRPEAGWHQRHKSDHFDATHRIVAQAGDFFGFDPWILKCNHRVVDSVDVTIDNDRQRLADAASDLFSEIKGNYARYGISEKPLIFIKSDSGTYGMGVMPIEDPHDIINLNRKGRNKLHKGKGSQPIHRFILQEGITSAIIENGMTSEPCIYQTGKSVIGGFFRQHDTKSNRDNLNAQGMQFSPIEWSKISALGIPNWSAR